MSSNLRETASVTHTECYNVVVDAELQSYSFWARSFSPLSSVVECDIIDQTYVMSDQEPVKQVDTSVVVPDCMH